MKLAASLKRNVAALATSEAEPMRPSGSPFLIISKNGGIAFSIIAQGPPSKYVGPGETEFTRMPLPASAWEALLA